MNIQPPAAKAETKSEPTKTQANETCSKGESTAGNIYKNNDFVTSNNCLVNVNLFSVPGMLK